ncbi:MAG TPA: DUF1385 domain-containing protein [Thermomicrobiales bacterium]|nr:DUF1385 domain-containing protein [Thermomicrobiales bacterium]
MAKAFYYGGQAVMEGVMMRGRSSMAVGVRSPDGKIVVWEEPLSPGPVVRSVRNIPFVRGAVVLWDTMVLGMRALIFSANVGLSEEGEDGAAEEPGALTGVFLWLTVALSLLFSIGLFFITPLVTVDILARWIENHHVVNIIEGVLRLGLLIGYMVAISYMSDIRRVFGYHGAEHMTINAWERGLPVDVENVREQSLRHVRCGTGFLLIVVLISILFFLTLGRPVWYLLYGSRILLVPVIAGVAYEVIRAGAAHASNPIMRAILAPGMWLQGITTRQPDDSMIEVAIAAFQRVLATDEVITVSELDPAVVEVGSDGQPLAGAPGVLPESAPAGIKI